MSRVRMTCLVLVLVLGVGIFVAAQAPETVAARHVRAVPITVGRLISAPIADAPGSFEALRRDTRTADVIGIVQTHDGALVPDAGTVVIRELLTGTAVGASQVNGLAQFSVRSLPPGVYTAELVDGSGSVVATSPAFTAGAGDVIQIAQTIPLRSDGFTNVLQSATALALTAAGSSGVIALRPGAPVTPGS